MAHKALLVLKAHHLLSKACKEKRTITAECTLSAGALLALNGSMCVRCRAETIAEPFYTFKRKGYNVDMASIIGGPIPIDPASVQPHNVKTHIVKLFLSDRADLLPPGLSKSSQETLLQSYIS